MDGLGRRNLNLLSLDGGGVRGYSELVILDNIMEKLQSRLGLRQKPKPCDYFDLIGGTSTGGLVAILLGRLRMSTEDALKEYDELGEKIFGKENHRYKLRKGEVLEKQYAPYKADGIVNAVNGIVMKLKESHKLKNPLGDPPSGKCVVFAVQADPVKGFAKRFRAYQHEDQWDKDVEIWEAARATSAAPHFFEPITVNGISFVDGALRSNNPTSEVLDEAGQLFKKTSTIGCILSLGTGSKDPVTLPEGTESKVAWALALGKITLNSLTDTEKDHEDLERRFGKAYSDTYIRLNVPGAASVVKLDHYRSMPELKAMTIRYLDSMSERVDTIVEILATDKNQGLRLGDACGPSPLKMEEEATHSSMGRSSNFFTGRKDILRQMSDVLLENQARGVREFLLCGMGGVGKTEIARKFHEMHGERFPGGAFWFDATNSATIKGSFKEHAEKHGLGPDAGVEQRVLEFLQRSDKEWLLIFDNVDPAGQAIANLVPRYGKGAIIYTSRADHIKMQLPQNAFAKVTELDEANAVTLLIRTSRTGDETDKSLQETCRPIVKELGYLPLAIDLAGAFVYKVECSLETYFSGFQKHIIDVENQIEDGKKKVKENVKKNPMYQQMGSQDRNKAVAATFEISYNVLQAIAETYRESQNVTAEEARMALKILNSVCFYHRENIREATYNCAAFFRHRSGKAEEEPLIADGYNLEDLLAVDDSGKWNPYYFHQGLRMLESFSLIKRGSNNKSFSMHALVHDWARERMNARDRAYYGYLTRRLLYDSITFQSDPALILYRQKINIHLDFCEARVWNRDWEGTEEAVYTTKKAQIAAEMGFPEEAEKAWKSALSIFLISHTRFHDETLGAMRALANLYRSLGRWKEAEELAYEIVLCREAMRKGRAKCAPIYYETSFQKKGGEKNETEQAASSMQRLVSRQGEKPMEDQKLMDDGTSEQISEHCRAGQPKQSKLKRLKAKFGEKDRELKKRMSDIKLQAKTKAVEMNLQKQIPPQLVGQKRAVAPEPQAVEDADDKRRRYAPSEEEREALLQKEILAWSFLSSIFDETQQHKKRLAAEMEVARLRKRSKSESQRQKIPETEATIAKLQAEIEEQEPFKAAESNARTGGPLDYPDKLDFPLEQVAKDGLSVVPSPKDYEAEEAKWWALQKQTDAAFGPFSLNAINYLRTLTLLLSRKSRATCAIIVGREAWARCGEMYGEDSYHNAAILQAWAQAYFLAGELEMALAAQEKCVAILYDTLGADSYKPLSEERQLEFLRSMEVRAREIRAKRERKLKRGGEGREEPHTNGMPSLAVNTESILPNACSLCCTLESHQQLVDDLASCPPVRLLPLYMEEYEMKKEDKLRPRHALLPHTVVRQMTYREKAEAGFP